MRGITLSFEIDLAKEEGCVFTLTNGLKATVYRLDNPRVAETNRLFTKLVMAEPLHCVWTPQKDYLIAIEFQTSSIKLIFSRTRLREVLTRLVSKDIEPIWNCFWVFLNNKHLPSNTEQGHLVLEAILHNIDLPLLAIMRNKNLQKLLTYLNHN